jgi:hypothetical protein
VADVPKINWPGISGKTYLHWIYPIGQSFLNQPGNYIFAKESPPGSWHALYVGEAEELGVRLSTHERSLEATQLGATHLHVHLNGGDRIAEEKDIIQKWNPPMNDHHRTR